MPRLLSFHITCFFRILNVLLLQLNLTHQINNNIYNFNIKIINIPRILSVLVKLNYLQLDDQNYRLVILIDHFEGQFLGRFSLCSSPSHSLFFYIFQHLHNFGISSAKHPQIEVHNLQNEYDFSKLNKIYYLFGLSLKNEARFTYNR